MSYYHQDGTTQAMIDRANQDDERDIEIECEECGAVLTPDGCPLCDKMIQSSCIKEAI